jgi:tetratricopeptide (TPR) repeat protein
MEVAAIGLDELMNRFHTPGSYIAMFGLFLGAALCGAQTQLPAMQANPELSRGPAEELPTSEALARMETQLRSELKANPNSAPTLYKLGLVLRQENKPAESLKIYTQAAAAQKPDADQLRSVALDYVLLNDFKDAIHWLEVAASFEPRNVDVLYSLGRCYYSQGKYHDAEDTYLRVLQINPDHLKAEENLGLTYDVENEPDKAEPALRKAVEWSGQESKDEWPFLDLGAFLLAHDRAADALTFLERSTAIAPKCAACHEKLGRALVATGKAADGVKELETAVQLDPKDPKIHFELGRAYRAIGDLEKSRSEFAQSQALYGQHSQN